jgi:uncharacterized membrane protein
MSRTEFIGTLTKRLSALGVADIEDIAAEYEEHFTYKLAEGYSEEEIARRLGDPAALADQFAPERPEQNAGTAKKVFLYAGALFPHVLAELLFTFLAAWTLVLGAAVLGSLALGACLAAGVSPFGWVPPMPYACALLFAVTLFALAVLAGLSAVYWAPFVWRLARSYGRYAGNILAKQIGRPTHPPLAIYAEFKPKTRRRLRKIRTVALCVFTAGFIIAYAACALSAGAFEFWHVWNWFV